MILYRKSRLRIAELYFDECCPVPAVDIVRYRSRVREVEGAASAPVHTILIGLRQDPEQIFRRMNSTKRNLINRAGKDDVTFEIDSQPQDPMLHEFFEFYDGFASRKNLPAANRDRINGVRQCGALTLSRLRDSDGDTLVWHCYIRASHWVRLHYSASYFREVTDRGRLALLSRANCYLHWRDMMHFRSQGLATYDLGGWYGGSDDKEKLGVNLFKEGFGGEVTRLFNADKGNTIRGAVALRIRHALGRMRGEK